VIDVKGQHWADRCLSCTLHARILLDFKSVAVELASELKTRDLGSENPKRIDARISVEVGEVHRTR